MQGIVSQAAIRHNSVTPEELTTAIAVAMLKEGLDPAKMNNRKVVQWAKRNPETVMETVRRIRLGFPS